MELMIKKKTKLSIENTAIKAAMQRLLDKFETELKEMEKQPKPMTPLYEIDLVKGTLFHDVAQDEINSNWLAASRKKKQSD